MEIHNQLENWEREKAELIKKYEQSIRRVEETEMQIHKSDDTSGRP